MARTVLISPKKTDLDLNQLGQGASALSSTWERFCGEAACVCLEERGHMPEIDMELTGFANRTFVVKWTLVSNQVRNTHEDREKATEYGAYGIAILLMNSVTNFKAFKVSRKENGFDLWMTEKDSSEPFQDAARLEVTGMRKGTPKEMQSRLKEKVDRLKKYPNPLVAFVVVVEFGSPQSILEEQ